MTIRNCFLEKQRTITHKIDDIVSTKNLPTDAIALIILVIAAVIFVRPQIEAWSISRAFMEASAESPAAIAAYVMSYVQAQFPRALEVIPMAAGSLSGGGAPIGWGIAYGSILVAKYLAARWALSKFLAPRQVAVLAILAVVMIPWEGQWRGHNVPMQAAALFLILAVGTILRCRDQLAWAPAIFTSVFVAMSLMSYGALLIPSLALPLMAALAPGRSAWPAVIARTFPLVLLPILAFAITTALMLLTAESRWTALANFPQHPSDNPLDAVALLYSTALFNSSMALIALPLYIFLLSESSETTKRANLTYISIFFLIILPWAALPFATSYSYIKDSERVGLPVAFGFFMLCTLISLVARCELRRSVAAILIATTTIAAVANAYGSWRPYGELQRPVLEQVARLVKRAPGKPVLVRDATNRLGDVFTFQHQNIFRDALYVLGVDSKLVDLCLIETPANRFHPDFVQLEFPLSPVPECAPPVAGSLVLDVQWKDRRPVVIRVNNR